MGDNFVTRTKRTMEEWWNDGRKFPRIVDVPAGAWGCGSGMVGQTSPSLVQSVGTGKWKIGEPSTSFGSVVHEPRLTVKPFLTKKTSDFASSLADEGE